jgi:hypothetical protein
MFRFPARDRDFSLLHDIQTGTGVRPASYPMGGEGSFPSGKPAGV